MLGVYDGQEGFKRVHGVFEMDLWGTFWKEEEEVGEGRLCV